jgi:nitroreductase
MAVSGAVLNLHLAARAQGLAGMWHSKGLSVHPVVRERLGWNDPAELLGIFMLGWPEGEWLEGERGPWPEKVSWIDSVKP